MVGAFVNIVTGVVFLIFGSADLQPYVCVVDFFEFLSYNRWAVEESKVCQLSENDLKKRNGVDEKY